MYVCLYVCRLASRSIGIFANCVARPRGANGRLSKNIDVIFSRLFDNAHCEALLWIIINLWRWYKKNMNISILISIYIYIYIKYSKSPSPAKTVYIYIYILCY